MLDFEGKVCWVTGASSGIGEEICRNLAKRGAIIILSSRNRDKLEDIQKSLSNPQKHLVLPLDMTALSDLDVILTKALTHSGGVDVLFNNAGISQRGLAIDTLVEVDRRIMEVDYFGAITLSKALLPHFLAKKSGLIVNIASVAGKLGVSMRSAYSGAKHALIGFMDCLRTEVFDDGVRVVNVCPGFVKTNLSYNALKGDNTHYDKMDHEIEGGMSSEVFVNKMFEQIRKGKEEIIIAEGLAKFGYHARRLFPQLFLKMSRIVYKRKD